MSDLQAIADRVEIEALRGEHADAANMGDYNRIGALFTHDAVWSMPDVNLKLVGQEEIRAGFQRLGDDWEYFVQNSHAGVIQLDGDTASGRDYIFEIGRQRDGRSVVNYALFHDRYRRTPDGWRFSERVYEVKYLDTTPLAGSPDVTWDD